MSQFFLMLAELCIRANRWQEAAVAMDRVPQGNPRWFADLDCLRGEFLSLRPERAQA